MQNFKVITSNEKIKNRISRVLTLLDMRASIHIQRVDFLIIDVKSIENIEFYKNKDEYEFLLFIANDDEDIEFLLKNSLLRYMKSNFSDDELKSWYNFFSKSTQNR